MDLVDVLQARIAVLEARLGDPPRNSSSSSQPPSSDRKADRPAEGGRGGRRAGSVGRMGIGRSLCAEPDRIVVAQASVCAHCRAGLGEADQVLHGRYDRIELPPVRPVVTRIERFAGRCRCCGGVTLAPVPERLGDGSPFGVSILAVALYLRFVHAVSYKRLAGLFAHLFALEISEGALDSLFRSARGRLDGEVALILTRLRRAVRARGHFPNDEAALKLLFLVLNRAEKDWKMPPREWTAAKAQMAVIFGDRFAKAMTA